MGQILPRRRAPPPTGPPLGPRARQARAAVVGLQQGQLLVDGQVVATVEEKIGRDARYMRVLPGQRVLIGTGRECYIVTYPSGITTLVEPPWASHLGSNRYYTLAASDLKGRFIAQVHCYRSSDHGHTELALLTIGSGRNYTWELLPGQSGVLVPDGVLLTIDNHVVRSHTDDVQMLATVRDGEVAAGLLPDGLIIYQPEVWGPVTLVSQNQRIVIGNTSGIVRVIGGAVYWKGATQDWYKYQDGVRSVLGYQPLGFQASVFPGRDPIVYLHGPTKAMVARRGGLSRVIGRGGCYVLSEEPIRRAMYQDDLQVLAPVLSRNLIGYLMAAL